MYKVYGQENLIAGDFSIGERRISESKFMGLRSCQLLPGDLILTMMGTIGKCAVFPNEAEIGIMDSHLMRIQLNTGIADHNFMAMVIGAEDFVGRQITRMSHGSIMSGLSSGIVRRLRIPLPPLPEQRRIAEILDTADAAIRQTEAHIAKLKQIKDGLLHDLLTRGVDAEGRLRDPLAHPEQFKDSPLGRIPREWEVELLGDACIKGGGSIQTGPFGSQLHAKDYTDEGIPIITVEHLGDNYILHTNLPLVGGADYKRLSRYKLQIGDLVFSRVGAIDRCAFVSEQEDGWLFSGRCLRVRIGNNLLYPRFLSQQLNSPPRRTWILNHSVGSTMACLNTSILSNVPVLVPSIDEQKRIATIFDTHDTLIRAKEERLVKLRQVKQGLMHDLLTGRVRV